MNAGGVAAMVDYITEVRNLVTKKLEFCVVISSCFSDNLKGAKKLIYSIFCIFLGEKISFFGVKKGYLATSCV